MKTKLECIKSLNHLRWNKQREKLKFGIVWPPDVSASGLQGASRNINLKKKLTLHMAQETSKRPNKI
jgi:hypothetical protein